MSRGRKMFALDASVLSSGRKGLKGQRSMADLGALRRERPGKRSVSRLRIHDILSCVSIQIDIQTCQASSTGAGR